VQYAEWIGKAVRGDLGESFFLKVPVSELIADRLLITLTLGICGLAFALVLSLPLGVLAAVRPNSWIDRCALALSVLGQALPSFWFALILIIVFGLKLRWLPVSGKATWEHFVLPAVALGYYATPAFMRLTRAGMLEVLASDYIRTARKRPAPACCSNTRGGTVAGPKHANHARFADIAMNLAAKFGKLAGDELGRAMLLEAKLGMCVQVLPPGGHFAVKQIDEMRDLHVEPIPAAHLASHRPGPKTELSPVVSFIAS
jgi:hypothetical protein